MPIAPRSETRWGHYHASTLSTANGRSAAMLTAYRDAWSRRPRWRRQEHLMSQWARARMRWSLNESVCKKLRSVIVLQCRYLEVARKHVAELARHVIWLVVVVHYRGVSGCRFIAVARVLGLWHGGGVVSCWRRLVSADQPGDRVTVMGKCSVDNCQCRPRRRRCLSV